MKSLTTQSPGLNVVSHSVVHGLVASGGDDGAVECFDPRKKASIGRIDTFVGTGDTDKEVTAVEFDEQHGHYMAAGTSAGKILIYDLRMSSPVTVKDHMYGSPILNIKWHQTLNSQDAKIISTDSHIVRVWDPNTARFVCKCSLLSHFWSLLCSVNHRDGEKRFTLSKIHLQSKTALITSLTSTAATTTRLKFLYEGGIYTCVEEAIV